MTNLNPMGGEPSAGPHTDAAYNTFVKDFSELKGWKWELQAHHRCRT
jgi:hypothetical protein